MLNFFLFFTDGVLLLRQSTNLLFCSTQNRFSLKSFWIIVDLLFYQCIMRGTWKSTQRFCSFQRGEHWLYAQRFNPNTLVKHRIETEPGLSAPISFSATCRGRNIHLLYLCKSLLIYSIIFPERQFCTTSNPITLYYFRFEWQLVWERVATQKFSNKSWRCPGSTSLPASQFASGGGRTDIWCCCCAWWGSCSCGWIPPPLCWNLQRWRSILNPDIPSFSLGVV